MIDTKSKHTLYTYNDHCTQKWSNANGNDGNGCECIFAYGTLNFMCGIFGWSERWGQSEKPKEVTDLYSVDRV